MIICNEHEHNEQNSILKCDLKLTKHPKPIIYQRMYSFHFLLLFFCLFLSSKDNLIGS